MKATMSAVVEIEVDLDDHISPVEREINGVGCLVHEEPSDEAITAVRDALRKSGIRLSDFIDVTSYQVCSR